MLGASKNPICWNNRVVKPNYYQVIQLLGLEDGEGHANSNNNSRSGANEYDPHLANIALIF